MTTKELANRCGCSVTYLLSLRTRGVINSVFGNNERGGKSHMWESDCIKKILDYKAASKEKAKVGLPRRRHPAEKRKLCERFDRWCVLNGEDDSCLMCETRTEAVSGIVAETMWLNEHMGATRTSVCRDFVR